MANAKQCDRCGKFYEIYHKDVNGFPANALVVIDEGKFIMGIDRETRFVLDLCPNCMYEFTKWLNEPEDIPEDEVI